MYVQTHEETAISKAQDHLKVLEKFVDGVYFIFKRTDVEDFIKVSS